ATVRKMMTEEKSHYGLGFGLEGTERAPRFGHNGADEGFQALMLCGVDGDGAVIMVNSDNGIRLATEIMYGIGAAYGWRDYAPQQRTTVVVPSEALATYAGTYEFSPKLRIIVRAVNDHLSVTQDQTEFAFYAESETTFFP